MPQFDFGTVFVPQLFWLAVFFALLYFGIVRLTLPRLGKVMDERESRIGSDLTAAEQAKSASDEMSETFQAEMEKTREAARQQFAEAQATAAAAREKKIAAANAKADAAMAAAEARIAEARDGARASINEVATDNARAIVAKLTGVEPGEAEAAGAVASAMGR